MNELRDLGARVGLQPYFDDAWGQRRDVSDITIRALLAEIGSTDERKEILPPVIVIQGDLDNSLVPLALPLEARGNIIWRLTLEDGASRNGKVAAVSIEAHGGLRLPRALPWGYHRLRLQWTSRIQEVAAETMLIVAPRRCFRPDALEGSGRRWGISLQLYSLRSERNWGIGDFTDLIAVLRAAGRLGAACVGLNPLHALFFDDPAAASPYSPNSRIYLNTLYIDVEAVEELQHNGFARRTIASDQFQARLRALREADRIDYPAVATCKDEILRLLYRAFRVNILSDADHSRAKSFRAFQQEQGVRLRQFAVFAIARSQINDPAAFAADHLEEVEYHEYLQWLADLQLAKAQDIARRLGLSIGLYQDLAVGISGHGADAWAYRDALIKNVSVGAPPDLWNMKGQNWGLSPFDPNRIRSQGYAPIRELLGAVMRRGGALRIDHILGFLRLYIIPRGMAPSDGAYLNYPWKELLAILALESHRHRCLVIGEDLGTVPPGLREDLDATGVLTTRVFYFEKQDENTFFSPSAYPTESMVTVGTHDLPTFAAYWSNADLALRTALDLWPTPQHRSAETAARAADHRAAAAFAGVSEDTLLAPVIPLYARLSAAPSRLLMVQLEDIAGQVAQMNVPGTWNEYPNWRVRLRPTIEEVFSSPTSLALTDALVERSDLPMTLGARSATGTGPGFCDVPRATYRVQFSQDFTFDDAVRIVPYLAALGVSHLYASPWLKARPGSTHGYDVVDHSLINPELGGAAGFENLSTVLRSYGIGHIVDFVPNHMGIFDGGNYLWRQVLEQGRRSPTASFFDIAWQAGASHLRDKVLLPVLDEHYGDALEKGFLQLRFDAFNGTFGIWYRHHCFPLAPSGYPDVIAACGVTNESLALIVEKFRATALPAKNSDGSDGAADAIAVLQSDLADLVHRYPEIERALRDTARRLSGITGEPDSFGRLNAILERQSYRLTHWAAAADEINYRRFFNVSDLAAIRIENPRLFAKAHSLVARLIGEDRLQGLRIDHVDGLFDPEAYCADLCALVREHNGGKPPYIIVEKILATHERLRQTWSVQGTTGYEFIAQVSHLLLDSRCEGGMTRIYHRFINDNPDFATVLTESKALVADTMFLGELRVLTHHLHGLARRHWKSSDYTRESLRAALRAVIIHFPVYRTYVSEDITPEDRRDIAWAITQAAKNWRAPGREILDFVSDAITGDLARGDSKYPAKEVVHFARLFQQFTSPIMAKSMEDTAFYRYHRLIALNEVGGDPRQFGLSLAAFHSQTRERARSWPSSLLTTSTHDTKRGEDVRARLLALPEIAGIWGHDVLGWAKLNERHKMVVDGRMAPDRNDEYLIYQTLVGAWPVEMDGDWNASALQVFAGRIRAFMTKGVREGKQNSSWNNPNADYETALCTFIDRVLDPKFGRAFLKRFHPFARRVARLGVWNSLVQTVLKLCLPGVPDFYQGAELWDFNLVDPDNRRLVDYQARIDAMRKLSGNDIPLARLRDNWQDGLIKFVLVSKLLALRQAVPKLFTHGAYEPIVAVGRLQNHMCVFQRRHKNTAVVVAVARHMAGLCSLAGDWPGAAAWSETQLSLPEGRWRDILTDEIHDSDGEIAAGRLFAVLPTAVLVPVR